MLYFVLKPTTKIQNNKLINKYFVGRKRSFICYTATTRRSTQKFNKTYDY